MDMNKYKRNYNFKSDEGNKKGMTWFIILVAVIIVAIAYFS